MEKISIKSDFIKLDSLLKFSGLAHTGGFAKQVILEGLVLVNGAVCVQRNKKIYDGDTVEFENQKIKVVKE